MPGADEPDTLAYNDRVSQEAFGVVESTYSVPAVDLDALADAALPAVAALFANDQSSQAIEILVHPSVRADVGDSVWLELTHPALWSYTDGRTGYVGAGRVVGRTLDLSKCAVTLRILIDGGTMVFALSPSAQMTAASASTSPSWIEVDGKYYAHFSATLDASPSGDFRVYHYTPGDAEGTSEYHTINGVTSNGSYCRLSVSASTGHTLTVNESYLTLPPSGTTTAFQDRFAHSGDGSNWG